MTPGEPIIRWDWLASHVPDFLAAGAQHIELTVIAVTVGFAIAFALSLAALRYPHLEGAITGVMGTLYTIPSLALFSFLVPFTGLGVLTSEIGLVGYTLLILMRNILGGIRGVSDDVREAAIGMGYTSEQLLWRIEVPLALAVIIAGVRIATVTTIGLVTVTALIGQGGFGALILAGMLTFFSTEIIAGATLSVALAVLADALLVAVQRRLTPWTRPA